MCRLYLCLSMILWSVTEWVAVAFSQLFSTLLFFTTLLSGVITALDSVDLSF
jgi:hypothetical protein